MGIQNELLQHVRKIDLLTNLIEDIEKLLKAPMEASKRFNLKEKRAVLKGRLRFSKEMVSSLKYGV